MRIDVHLHPDELRRALREDVERGLTSDPKELPPKWFYDERGSRLFDEITRLPEYYPTRREREILIHRSGEIASLVRADTLVELGAGTSEKTRILLTALKETGLRRFVPFDVSEEVLRSSARDIERAFGLEVHALVGDFDRHLGAIASVDGAGTRRLVAFLGSTIGNFAPDERKSFLKEMCASLEPDDHLLVGFDLVKDVARLEAAYNDERGVTADFNRNVLSVINRELGADFDADAFVHVAAYDRDRDWIEMKLRSTRAARVRIEDIGLDVELAEGEEIRTELSAKFRPHGVARELEDAGLGLERWWTDDRADFGLALARVS